MYSRKEMYRRLGIWGLTACLLLHPMQGFASPADGEQKDGWVEEDGVWYHLDENGEVQTGWCWIDGECYYFNENGAMASDTWIGEYYVDSNGVWIPDKEKEPEERWVETNGRWWYREADGTYPCSTWKKIKGIWYYFDADGWMTTGWQKVDGKWYYMNESGAMQIGWVKVKGIWYYLSSSGAMQTGWIKLGETWYYLSESGAMQTGWIKLKGIWYYLSENGAMQTDWIKLGETWYYLSESGAMQTGWIKLKGSWYYLQSNGAMKTGWLKLEGNWYYLQSNGAMKTGWLKLKETWYYLAENGAMVTGWETIGNATYYFDDSGAMLSGISVDGIVLKDSGEAIIGVSGTTSIKGLLLIALQPVGQTMYVYGGGHDTSEGGDGVRIGVNPQWRKFYEQQDGSYDYTQYRYKHGYGLDCSGLVGWSVYNTLNTRSNQAGYSSTSTEMPGMLADSGMGTCETVSGSFMPGDIVSKSGHVWIVLGTCQDGSVVLIHATPPVIQISGTVSSDGNYNSEAKALADKYMKKYYSHTANTFKLSVGDKTYLNDVSRFRWSESVLKDEEKFRNMSAEEILQEIYE